MPDQDHQLPKVDFTTTQPTSRPRRFRKTLLVGILLFIITPLFLVYALISDTQGFITLPNISWIKQLGYLIGSKEKDLKADSNRINILLAGIGGEGHDGPQLTDTIILASLDIKTKKVAMLSIPRDLYVPVPLEGYGWRKINNLNSFGEQDNYPGGGMALLSKSVEKTFGVPINYYVRVDFQAFKDIVDQLNGINVEVDNSFTDYQYPTYDYKVQTISFEKGRQHFDGEKALQFVRSRHGNNGEGSDFARSKRQQKVILAIKEKALATYGIMNIGKIIGVFNALQKNIQTNLEPWEIWKLAQIFKDIDLNSINHVVLDDSPDNLLYSSITPDGAYILLPKGNSFQPVADLAKNMLGSDQVTAEKDSANKLPVSANQNNNTEVKGASTKNASTKLIIQNGSGITGLAQKVADRLSSFGYKTLSTGNAPSFDYQTTVIYDTSSNQNSEALADLKSKLNANIAPELTPTIKKLSAENPEAGFIIILGKNNN